MKVGGFWMILADRHYVLTNELGTWVRRVTRTARLFRNCQSGDSLDARR